MALATQALERGPDPEGIAYFRACATLVRCDRLALARVHLEHALEHARRLGSVPALVRAEAWLAVAALHTGELEAAVAHATTALGAGRHTTLVGPARAALTLALIERDGRDRPSRRRRHARTAARPRTASPGALGHAAAHSRTSSPRATHGSHGAPARRWPGRPRRSRARSTPPPRASGRRARSASRCGRWPRSGRRRCGRSGAATRSRSSPRARRGWSTGTRCATSVPACAASAPAATPASRSARHSTSPSAAAPPRSPAAPARSWPRRGARPRRLAQSGRDSLTPAELRVAGLAARGLANREIAQTLFVTVKTVETELGHAYAKLGIRSRRDLAAALTQS